MFNLFISWNPETWDASPYEIEKARFCEYTRQDIREVYLDFFESNEKKDAIKSFPCLFAVENEEKESRIGFIRDLKDAGKNIEIHYSFDSRFAPIPKGKLKELAIALDIGKWEISRTHWAIKDVNLFQTLTNFGLLNGTEFYTELLEIPVSDKKNVFIVHGHDSMMRNEVKEFVSSELKLNPIILSEVPSHGMTIMEKLERYADQGYGVILYSPCDIGGKRNELPTLSFRARQNVVFEHGFLTGKLGRSNVIALKKGDVETPSDINGVVYIPYEEDGWKEVLRREFSEQINM